MNNQPAFPIVIDLASSVEYQTGMTLLDYFAAKAMQGLMHNYHPCDFLEHKGWIEDISMASYQLADAMLAAREKA
jgi:hypothetical protein